MNETKINGETLDIADENIANLRQLFPEVFTDGKIDFSMLKQSLGEYVDDESEKYKFTWNGKGKAINLAQTPSTGTLRPCPGESKNFDETENLYIEGDNLEVLKLLGKSYYNKIKMIYIDPPYNTGKDFVYKDNFKDNIANYLETTGQTDEQGRKVSPNTEQSGRYHTDWLNMMYPRLRLARNLLKDDGVIFISIDDNEVHNLRKMCDEVFGERNFVGTFVVNSTPNARDYGHIGKMHEFVMFYVKNRQTTETYMLKETAKKFKYVDERGGFNIHPLYNSNEAFTNINRPNLYYPFYLYLDEKDDNEFFKIGLENKKNSIVIYPPKSVKNSIQFVWRWGKEKSLKYINKDIVGYKTKDGEYRIVQKMRHSEKIIRSLLTDKGFSSRKGTAELQSIFNGKYFSFPKPISLINRFINIATKQDDIILDFFSGSATTAHAVMQLNAEDGGCRKFIMVQLPEVCDEKSEAFKAGYKNICEIGKERIRRAGEKIKTETLEFNKKLKDDTIARKVPDIGFKVLKLARSNFKKWQIDPENIEASLQENLDNHIDNRTDMDFIYEIMLKYGIILTSNVETLSFNETKLYYINCQESSDFNLIICLDDNIKIDTANFIIKHKTDENIYNLRVVFKDSGFNSDEDKINTREILKCGEIQEFITI